MGYNCSYELGIIRNHYVGRTFIAPNQNEREVKVQCKFNAIKSIIKKRDIILVDDSIVRGTTSKLLIKMLRFYGARSVHLRVASPPVMNPCYYGMDFPDQTHLMAHQFDGDLEKMATFLHADSLAYLSVEGLLNAVKYVTQNNNGDPSIDNNNDNNNNNNSSNNNNSKKSLSDIVMDQPSFCTACFTNLYPVPINSHCVQSSTPSPSSLSLMGISMSEEEEENKITTTDTFNPSQHSNSNPNANVHHLKRFQW